MNNQQVMAEATDKLRAMAEVVAAAGRDPGLAGQLEQLARDCETSAGEHGDRHMGAVARRELRGAIARALGVEP